MEVLPGVEDRIRPILVPSHALGVMISSDILVGSLPYCKSTILTGFYLDSKARWE